MKTKTVNTHRTADGCTIELTYNYTLKEYRLLVIYPQLGTAPAIERFKDKATAQARFIELMKYDILEEATA